MRGLNCKNENNITYHGGRNRQPIWNRNKAVGTGRHIGVRPYEIPIK